MAITDRLREVVIPLALDAAVDLYDVEHHGARVRVLIDAEGGIDVDRLARFSRSLSRTLDTLDIIDSSYTLEVSSPGLERPLRTPEHFRGATGNKARFKLWPGTDKPRRLTGTIEVVGLDGVWVQDEGGETIQIGFDEIASARTVFEWGQAKHPKKA